MAMATKMVMVTATRVGEVGGRRNGYEGLTTAWTALTSERLIPRLFKYLNNCTSISVRRSFSVHSTVSSLSLPSLIQGMLPGWTLVCPRANIDTLLCVGQNAGPKCCLMYFPNTLSFFPVMLSVLIIAVYCTVDICCAMGVPCFSIAATNASL